MYFPPIVLSQAYSSLPEESSLLSENGMLKSISSSFSIFLKPDVVGVIRALITSKPATPAARTVNVSIHDRNNEHGPLNVLEAYPKL